MVMAASDHDREAAQGMGLSDGVSRLTVVGLDRTVKSRNASFG